MITVEQMVRDMRVQKEITQLQLAERIATHKQMVSNFERGACQIPLKYFSTIAKMLDLDLQLMIAVRIANLSAETRSFFD